jgi:Pectate lyase superfamily protein
MEPVRPKAEGCGDSAATRRRVLAGMGAALGASGALAAMPDRASAQTSDQYALKANLPINVKDKGANGDDSVSDSPAFAAAIAALPTAGGSIEIPPGTYVLDQPINLDNRRSITIFGSGSPSNGFGTGTVLIYTGTGTTPFISAKQSQGIHFEHLDLRYNSSAFTGHLIDLRNASGVPANDTHDITFTKCNLGANPATGLNSAASLVRCNNSHGLTFEDTWLFGAVNLIWGRETAASYVNALVFSGGGMINSTDTHILNGGDSWNFVGTRFEARADNRAGIYRHGPGLTSHGFTFVGCWVGDVLVGGGNHIRWSGDALVILGGHWGHEVAGGTYIQLDENNCKGIQILGTDFQGGDAVLDFTTTTGHQGIVVQPAALQAYGNSTPALTAGTSPPTTSLVRNPANGYWNSMYVDGNVVIPGNGAFVARGQGALANVVLAARASGAGDVADRFVLRADGSIARGTGGAPPTVEDLVGSGSPVGVRAAAVGSTYRRIDGVPGATFYVKESGTGTAGWAAK